MAVPLGEVSGGSTSVLGIGVRLNLNSNVKYWVVWNIWNTEGFEACFPMLLCHGLLVVTCSVPYSPDSSWINTLNSKNCAVATDVQQCTRSDCVITSLFHHLSFIAGNFLHGIRVKFLAVEKCWHPYCSGN